MKKDIFEHEANGKLTERNSKAQKIQDAIGIQAKNPFGVKTIEALEEKLSNSSLIDLRRLAINAGESASGTVPTLKKKIKGAFKKFQSNCGGYKVRDVEQCFSEEQKRKVMDINKNG